MANNAPTLTNEQTDELLELLNDKTAPVVKYREILSSKESGQLILPTGFESVIESLENKYKDTVDDNNCLIDINTLKVYDGQDLSRIEPVSSEEEGEEEELIQHINSSGPQRPVSNVECLTVSSDSSEESDQEVEFVRGSTLNYQKLFNIDAQVTRIDHIEADNQDDSDSELPEPSLNSLLGSLFPTEEEQVPQVRSVNQASEEGPMMASAPARVANRQSWPVAAYDPPQYHKAPVSTLVSYELPSSSKIYDGVFQARCLQQLKQHLLMKSKLGLEIRADIEAKIMKTLGMGAIPNPSSISVLPFLHFDDNGEYHVSILFDCPPHSPWSLYTRNMFGSEFIKLQKEVYELVRTSPGSSSTSFRPLAHSAPSNVQSITAAGYSASGQKVSAVHKSPKTKTKVTQKKSKITSPNRKTVIEMYQREYYTAHGDLSTSDLDSSTTGSEFARNGPERLYLQSLKNQPRRQLQLELNGVPVKDRTKANQRKANTEKKAPAPKKVPARKSLPTLPMPNFRDFELGASRPSISSTPSTRTSASAAPSSVVFFPSRDSPEIGISDDVASSMSIPSASGAFPRITFSSTSTPARKGRPVKKTTTSKVSKDNKTNGNSNPTPPQKRPSEVEEAGAVKKRKSETGKDAAKGKVATPKASAKENKKVSSAPSSKTAERVSARINSSMTAAHVMSTPTTKRPESRSDVPKDVSSSPQSSRVLRPRKSLLSPSKLQEFVVA